jgi:peptidoglycan/LPS O-acetylase OafA/YrhL
MARSEKTGWALFRDFYVRRAFRIYPLSGLIVLALVPAKIPDAAWNHYPWVGWYAVLNDLLLISNITHTPDIISPLWSLTFEVQMYLALPLLYLATKKRTCLTAWSYGP